MMKLVWLLIGPTLLLVIGLIAFQNIIITFLLFYGWLFLIPFLEKETWRYKGEIRKYILVGVSSGLICMLFIISTSLILQDQLFDLPQVQKKMEIWGFTGNKVFLFILILIFINPFLEEWYWRGFIYRKLIEKTTVVNAILYTSFFYALYHLFLVIYIFTFPFSIIAFLGVLLAGALWGIIRHYYQTIYPTIISHCLADIGIIIVYALVVLGGGTS